MLHISIIQEQLLGILSMDNAETIDQRRVTEEEKKIRISNLVRQGHIYKYNDKLTSEISYS